MTKTVVLPPLTELFFIFFWLYLFPVSLTAQQKTNQDSSISSSLIQEVDSLTAQQKTNQDSSISSSLIQEVDKSLVYFTNTVLINQFGEEMKFYEDLLADKIVVINPFFSECLDTCCSTMHNRLQRIQEHFGDRIGKDIILISITLDPKVDQPDVLREYAKRFEAKRGWYFLTGTNENVDFILQKLGKNMYQRDYHDTIILIGNLPTGLWKKIFGLLPENEIIKAVENTVNDRI